MAAIADRSGMVPTKMRTLLVYLRSAFWFLPACLLLVATLLAWGALTLDEVLGTSARTALFFEGDVTGARELLGTIAGSMIAVGTTIFSITLVALQLASTQFGPRILTNFVSDRGNQVAMGVFIGVFWYCLLILRQLNDGGNSLPYVAVTVSAVLAAVAVGVLVWFIHHIVRSIQVMNIVQSIAADLERRVEKLFPHLDAEHDLRAADADDAPRLVGKGHGIRAESSGYLRLVDLETLVHLAAAHDLVVRLETRPGQFIVQGTAVLHAWHTDGSPAAVEDEVCHALAGCLYPGPQRSQEQDIEHPARQLVEVAVRALSPSINDPITATACVHHLGVALSLVAGRSMPPEVVADREGTPRLLIGSPITFRRLVGVCYDQVRQLAEQHTYVYLQLMEALTQVTACSNHESQLAPLHDQGRLVLERAGQALAQEADLALVREAFAALEARIERARRECRDAADPR